MSKNFFIRKCCAREKERERDDDDVFPIEFQAEVETKFQNYYSEEKSFIPFFFFFDG